MRPVDIGEFVARLAGPGVAARQHESCFPFRRKMRAFDMFVDLAEAGNGRETRLVKVLARLAGIRSRRAEISDAPAFDDDLPVLLPRARMHIEQTADAQDFIRRPLAERGQGQVLADAYFLGGV